MSEQLYKLKDEVKKYVDHELHTAELTHEQWLDVFSIIPEALEPVPNRVELINVSWKESDFRTVLAKRGMNTDFTEQERLLCEQALNGDMPTINEIIIWTNENLPPLYSAMVHKWLNELNTTT